MSVLLLANSELRVFGLPVLLAMQTVRWQPKGNFEFGFPSEPATQLANLLFHETNPIVQVTVQNRILDFTLDTGAVDTDLNQVFAKELPALVTSGQKETHASPTEPEISLLSHTLESRKSKLGFIHGPRSQ